MKAGPFQMDGTYVSVLKPTGGQGPSNMHRTMP